MTTILDQKKQIAEIQSIEVQTSNAQGAAAIEVSKLRIEKAKIVATLAGILLSFAIGLATWHVEQEKQRKFEVNSALVKLLEKLSRTETPNEQQIAAAAMPLYGQQSTNILIASLRIVDEAEVLREVQWSLGVVSKESEQSRTSVLRQLLFAAKEIVKLPSTSQHKGMTAHLNAYLDTIELVYAVWNPNWREEEILDRPVGRELSRLCEVLGSENSRESLCGA